MLCGTTSLPMTNSLTNLCRIQSLGSLMVEFLPYKERMLVRFQNEVPNDCGFKFG